MVEKMIDHHGNGIRIRQFVGVAGFGCWLAFRLCPLVAEDQPAATSAAPQADLLFFVTYNAQSEKAEFARGKPESLNFRRTLQYVQAPGVVKAGFQTLENERCDYEMTKNFDPREGTLGIWVRPENWRPADNRSHVFFAAEIPGKYRILLYKPAEKPIIELQVSDPGKNGKSYRVYAQAESWQSKNWHRIDATWNSQSLKVYLDGALAAEADPANRAPQSGYAFPAAEPDGTISINPNNYFKGQASSSPSDFTSVDEVTIHGKALSAEMIKASFLKVNDQASGSAYRKPLITIPLDRTPVKIDGRIEAKEWENACRVPMLHVPVPGDFSARFSDVRLKYDEENLYLGFHARGEKNPIARVKERDGWVWEDGAFEVVGKTAGPEEVKFQFIINSLNSVFDIRNNDKAWNGVNKTAAGLDGDGWSAEVALSFKELGVAPPKPGTAWAGNFMHDWEQLKVGFATWSYIRGFEFSDSKTWGALIFGGESPGIHIESLGELGMGKVDARVSISGRSGATEREVKYKVANDQGLSRELDKKVKPGDNLAFPNSIATPGRSQLYITVTDLQGKEELIYDQVFTVKPPIILTYQCWPSRKVIDVSIDLTNMGPDALKLLGQGTLKGEVALTDADGKKVLSRTVALPKAPVSTWQIPFPKDFPEGKYRVNASFPKPAGGAYEEQKSLCVPPDAPFKAKAGVSREVPDPWTPIDVAGDRLRVLDREYLLGDSPFPVKMVSLGNEILAKPIELVLTTDKGEERIVWDKPKIKEKFGDEIYFNGRGRAGKSNIQAEWSGRLEFDGQWLADITLTPNKTVPVKAMALEYEVNSRSATYVLAMLCRPWEKDQVRFNIFDTISGQLPTKGGFWLTGLKTGLYFFTTTDGNWMVKPDQPNVRISRFPDKVKVRIQVIDQPVVLDKPASYVFGFTATPAKRQPGANFSSGEHTGPGNGSATRLNWSSLVTTTPDRARKDFEECKKRGLRYTYWYGCPCFLTEDDPYVDFWGATWQNSWGSCPNSSMRELLCYQAENMSRDIGWGIYFDLCGIYWCSNQEHGCGYIDSLGKEAKTMPILGFRDELKRVYKITHQHGRLVWNHNHSMFHLPASIFSDMWYPGEQYTTWMENKDHFYSQDVKREEYLVEMNPFIHGVAMLFLPELGRSYDLAGDKNWERWTKPECGWYTEQLLTMLLPHDIENSGAYMYFEPVKKVWDIYNRLGIYRRMGVPGPRPVFMGYWDNPKITASDPEIMLSYYTFPGEKKVLAVASNPTMKTKLIKLKIDPEALGLNGPLTIRDEYRNQELSDWKNKGIEIPTENFRLLLIK